MKLIQVRNKVTERDFLELPEIIYKNDTQWVSHLDRDIKMVFDRERNGYFKHGEAVRWVLYNEQKKPIGRVAAFIDHEANIRTETKAGGMGFFECIHDKDAAFALFDACSDWLRKKDIQVMDGPVNFGERDRFWGLMIEGFKNPSYLENYNPPYYRDFFEAYGFQKFFEQTTSEVSKSGFKYERFKRIADRVNANPDVHFKSLNMDQADIFAEDFCAIYNAAWGRHENFNPLSSAAVKSIMHQMRHVVIPEFVCFAYVKNEPAGFFVNILEANEIFKHLNGKLHWLNKLRFLFYRYFQKPTRLKGIVFGVKPAFQNQGIETGMIMHIYEEMLKNKDVENFELAWVGDFNPKMQSLLQALGCRTIKVHATYRKLLSSDIEFKRYQLKK